MLRGEVHDPKAHAEQQQTRRHFHRERRQRTAPRETQPQHGDRHGEDQDEQRIDRQEPARGHLPAKENAAGVALREKIHHRTRLLEARPEQRRREEQNRHHREAFLFHRLQPREQKCPRKPQRRHAHDHHRRPLRQRHRVDDQRSRKRQRRHNANRPNCGPHESPVAPRMRARRRRLPPRLAEMPARHHVLHHAQYHPHTRRRKAVVPVQPLAEQPADDRPDERAQIHPHVKQREPRVAPRPALGIKLPHQRAGIRFQKRRTEDYEQQPSEKRARVRHRQREVPQRDHAPAPQHRALRPEQPVRDPPARQRHEIHRARIKPVDRARRRLIQPEPAARQPRRHVEDEQRPHPVVAHALPHLREVERVNAARVRAGGGYGGVGHFARE